MPSSFSTSIEAAAWVVFLGALVVHARATLRRARVEGDLAWLLGILAFGILLRLVLPWAPTHWYYTGGNVGAVPGVFDKATTRIPWIDRAVGFDLQLADRGLGAVHLVASVFGAVMIWSSLQPHARRALRIVTTAAFVTIPMYARFSVTDSSHLWAWVCFASAAAALSHADDEAGTAPHLYLLVALAPILGAPIRLESSPLLITAALWPLAVRPLPIREALATFRRPLVVAFVPSAIAGLALALHVHHTHAAERLHVDLARVAFAIVLRAILFLPCLTTPVSPFPLVLTILVWIYLGDCIRRRDRTRLGWTAVASTICAGPAIFGESTFADLGGAGYAVVALSFTVLWSAFGALCVARWAARSPRRRALFPLASAAVLAGSFVPPYISTLSFTNETTFLRRAIAGRQGRILALADPQSNLQCHQDKDATVALPDALLVVRDPNLQWTVVDQAKLDAENLPPLAFDYYYRGGDLELDPTSIESRYGRLVDGDPQSRRCHEDHLVRMRQIDEAIRARYPMRVVAEETVSAKTFSFVAFPDDRETLRLYARNAATGDDVSPTR